MRPPRDGRMSAMARGIAALHANQFAKSAENARATRKSRPFTGFSAPC